MGNQTSSGVIKSLDDEFYLTTRDPPRRVRRARSKNTSTNTPDIDWIVAITVTHRQKTKQERKEKKEKRKRINAPSASRDAVSPMNMQGSLATVGEESLMILTVPFAVRAAHVLASARFRTPYDPRASCDAPSGLARIAASAL